MIRNTDITRLMDERALLTSSGRASLGATALEDAVLTQPSVSPVDIAAKLQVFFERSSDKAAFRQLWSDIAVELATGDPEAATVIGDAIPKLAA